MFLPVKLKDGGEVFVEVAPGPAGGPGSDLVLEGTAMGAPEKAAEAITKAEPQFAAAVKVAQAVAEEVSEGLVKKEGASRQLSEVIMELSLGFTAKGHIFLAQAEGTAALKLTLKWSLPK